MELSWSENSNLENSLYYFLTDKISSDNIQVRNNEGKLVTPEIRISKKFDSNWKLPVITLKQVSMTEPQFLIGTSRTDRTYLVSLDIFSENETQKYNLSAWLRDAVEKGFLFYNWTPQGNNPIKTLAGRVTIEFVTDTEILFGENVDESDKYRWRISLNCQICYS